MAHAVILMNDLPTTELCLINAVIFHKSKRRTRLMKSCSVFQDGTVMKNGRSSHQIRSSFALLHP